MKRIGPVALLLAAPALMRVVFWSLPPMLLPSLFSVALGLPAALGLRALRNPYNRLVAALWLVWWWIGNLNLIGSYVTVGNYYAIDVNPALRTYMVFSDIFVLGLWFGERTRRASSGFGRPLWDVRDDLPRSFRAALLVFPFAWLASMVLTLGYLPLAKGEDITFDMYGANYGPLYGLTALCASSVFYAVYRALRSEGMTRAKWTAYAITVTLLSVSDGKRFVALIASLAALVLLAHFLQGRTWRALPVVALGGMGLYVGIALLRQGLDGSAQLTDLYARLAMVGVEFRDFALSMEMFEPGRVPGYEWASSAFAAMINGKLLAIFGVNKGVQVQSGSAYVWMEIFGTGLGIRTGLVSELWFAYGWAGGIAVFLFGVASSLIADWLVRAGRLSSLLFGAQIYALAVLEINGQSTAATGTIAVLGYLWLAYAGLRALERRARPAQNPRRSPLGAHVGGTAREALATGMSKDPEDRGGESP